jgi:hypothetical protein
MKPIFAACLLLHITALIHAQVGIGTPTPSSKLEVVGAGTTSATAALKVGSASSTILTVRNDGLVEISSTTQGFLPPRVALTATNSTSPINSPATGLLVYNTTAGTLTATTNVTPGLYYYDGSKWQRIINQQPDATVSFNTSNPTTGGTTFTPNTPASTDYIYVSSVDNSQWTYNGTTYVTYTPPASTAWYSENSTADAGSNKSSGVYRTGNVGIGTGSFTPSTKLHIVSSTSGGGFRLVDGTQGANKVLQSDASGNASWATNVSITAAVIGSMGNGAQNTGANSYTGASITLPPGKWSVSVSMLGIINATGNFWVQTGFSGTTNSSGIGADGVTGGPTLISGLVVGNANNMITGTVIINNISSANKTYYYCTASTAGQTLTNLGRNQYGENTIIAYPMN